MNCEIMRCIRCGWIQKSGNVPFVCKDCEKFSKIIKEIWDDVDDKFENLETIDPHTDPILKLLADVSFVTSHNPHTTLFYDLCSLMVNKCWQGALEITETELNRRVRTTKSFSDALKTLEELNLITVKTKKYERILEIQEKVRKLSSSFELKTPNKQIEDRLIHIFTGYVLLWILQKIANIHDEKDLHILPYSQKPRTLWVTLMFLWSKPYEKKNTFSDEELRIFLGRRGIPSTTRGKIQNALHNMTGRNTPTGLFKDIKFVNGNKKYYYDDYVIREMERIRMDRERERGKRSG